MRLEHYKLVFGNVTITHEEPMPDPTPSKPRPAAPKADKPKAPPKSKRERWNSLYVKRVKNARRALRNVARMGNVAGYEYTHEEAAQVIAILKADMAEVERAFRGTPKEKGMFDL